MLEGLDGIDWAALSHAYGSAGDVPETLRALASADDEAREEALEELWGSIWHQGTVYPATAPAVPFLIELAERREVRGRESILVLLQAIGTGSSHLEVHQELDDTRMERETPEFQALLARELEHSRAARAAVVAGTPVYLRLLEDSQPEVRRTAPYVLAACGEQANTLIPALTRRVDRESDPPAKASMIFGIGAMHRSGALPAEGSQRLDDLARMEREAPVVRLAAALVLVRFGAAPPSPELLVTLQRLLPAAMEALGALPWSEGEPLQLVGEILAGQPDLRLAGLREVLGDPKPEKRRQAVFQLEQEALRRRGAAVAVAPLLGDALADPDAEVREAAAHSLACVGPAVALAADALLRCLEDPASSATARSYAAYALAKGGDPRALPHLLELLRDPETRRYALEALRALGPAALPALPALRERLRDRRDDFHLEAVLVLGAIGPAAEEALPEVVRALRRPYVATGAAYALDQWGAAVPAAIRPLTGALRHADPLTRRNAARALGRFGPAAAAAAAVRALGRLLRDPDGGARAEAALALWRIARDARAVPVLAEIVAQARGIKGGSEPHAARAAECLGEIGPAADAAVPALREALAQDYQWLRVHAARALWRMHRDPGEVLPTLLEELRARPAGLLVLECLAEIGPPAAAAVPTLRRFIDSETPVLETSTTETLVEEDEALRAACERTLAAVFGGNV